LVAAQLKALSKNPNVQDFRVEERSRELLITTHSLSIIGVEPELVLGKLLIVINFGGAYPGVKVMSAENSVRASPAPCVNEDGELLNDNLKLALPGLLGKFQYNQLVSSVCQVLKRPPADFSSSQLQTWRDARERMA
jgi:hypothetical protein